LVHSKDTIVIPLACLTFSTSETPVRFSQELVDSLQASSEVTSLPSTHTPDHALTVQRHLDGLHPRKDTRAAHPVARGRRAAPARGARIADAPRSRREDLVDVRQHDVFQQHPLDDDAGPIARCQRERPRREGRRR